MTFFETVQAVVVGVGFLVIVKAIYVFVLETIKERQISRWWDEFEENENLLDF